MGIESALRVFVVSVWFSQSLLGRMLLVYQRHRHALPHSPPRLICCSFVSHTLRHSTMLLLNQMQCLFYLYDVITEELHEAMYERIRPTASFMVLVETEILFRNTQSQACQLPSLSQLLWVAQNCSRPHLHCMSDASGIPFLFVEFIYASYATLQ